MTAKPIAPVGLSVKGLRTLTASIPQPIYWAGPKPGYLYELTRTSTGKIFVRYLPPGTQVGSKKATYLIVATYPFRNALKALTDLRTQHQLKIPGGGIAIVDASHPQSVHLAFPGSNNQVEVYDPVADAVAGDCEVWFCASYHSVGNPERMARASGRAAGVTTADITGALSLDGLRPELDACHTGNHAIAGRSGASSCVTKASAGARSHRISRQPACKRRENFRCRREAHRYVPS